MKPLLVPSCLAEETELLEAMDWDEEGLVEVLDLCKSAIENCSSEQETASSLSSLHREIASRWDEKIARLAISLFIKRAIQYPREEIEA